MSTISWQKRSMRIEPQGLTWRRCGNGKSSFYSKLHRLLPNSRCASDDYRRLHRATRRRAAGNSRGNSLAAGYLVSVFFDCYGSPNPICSIKLVSSRVDAMVVAVPTSLIMDKAMRNSADDQGPAMRGGDAEQGFGLRRAEHADG